MIPVAPGTPLITAESFALLAATVEKQATVVWKGASEGLKSAFEPLIIGIQSVFAGVPEENWRQMLSPYVQAGLIPQSEMERLIRLCAKPNTMGLILFAVVFYKILTYQYDAIFLPLAEKVSQAALKEARPTLPPYSSAIQAAFVAPEKIAQVRDYLARNGFSDEAIDLMFIANYKLYDELTVRDLFWRKVLTSEQVFERMRELGYTDTRIKEITQSWSVIPTVQDLLTMVGHEAFEPDSIAKMGLDEEFPEEQSEWMEKMGLSTFWQRKYWISHWEQPSIGMGYEMLQRGIIDREDLEFLFRTVEIPRYWRDKLLKIAYTPYTRVDARRMHKLGVLTDEELITAFKDIGYDQTHAEKMAEFTKKANKAAEKDLSKAEVLTGYADKVLTQAQASEFLVRLGYDEDEATYILALADYKEKAALSKTLQSSIEARYKGSVIDKAEARRLLDEMNLPSAQTDALLLKWDSAFIQDIKLPSKTDFDNFYLAGLMNADVYAQELRKLGYASTYIDYYTRLLNMKLIAGRSVPAGV